MNKERIIMGIFGVRPGTRLYTCLFCICFAFALTGCPGEKAMEKGDSPAKPAVIKTALAVSMPVDRGVEATGTLLAFEEVVVSSETAGTMARIYADMGDGVNTGQAIALLDQREANLFLEDANSAHQTNIKTVEKAGARAIDSKAAFDRHEGLFKQGMVSVSQYDGAKTQYDVAVAELKEAEARLLQTAARLKLAKKRLADTVIKSPISGFVARRSVSAGEVVRERAGLFVIVASHTLKFRASVPEVSAPSLKTGADVILYIDAFKDRAFTGKLTRVSPAITPETRTLEIEAEVPNNGNMLKPGYFARGTVVTEKGVNAVFVPEAAVYSLAGVNKVFVVSGGVASERSITAGQRKGGLVEIPGGAIRQGEVVAVSNLSNLFEGAKVGVKEK